MRVLCALEDEENGLSQREREEVLYLLSKLREREFPHDLDVHEAASLLVQKIVEASQKEKIGC